jgi:putative transposase
MWRRPSACAPMSYHERDLPHYCPPGATLFLTRRLFGSLPRGFQGCECVAESKPGRATLVADAIRQGETEYHLYELFALAIVPNHVHAVVRPSQPLPVIMRWLKGSMARSANTILGRTGRRFWQCETYDHCIRNADEFNRIVKYVERNPVRAGLVHEIEDWPWSSAGRRPTPHEIAGVVA